MKNYSTSLREMQIKHNELTISPVKLALIQKSTSNKMLGKSVKKGTLYTDWWEIQTITATKGSGKIWKIEHTYI